MAECSNNQVVINDIDEAKELNMAVGVYTGIIEQFINSGLIESEFFIGGKRRVTINEELREFAKMGGFK